jgi:hypothetical protein
MIPGPAAISTIRNCTCYYQDGITFWYRQMHALRSRKSGSRLIG